VPPQYAVDNGVMIAWTGLLAFKSGMVIDPKAAFVRQRWRIDEVEILWK
jgi:N6-L-threonylcarbamoyladenine synthase